MANKQVVLINGWKVPKLMKYEIGYNKLYADDSGRDLDGNNRATLIGIFPKLQVKVGSLTEQEMSEFLKRVNTSELSVSWYDPEIKGMRNGISYYVNDFNVSIKRTDPVAFDGFSFNLIPNKKR